MKILSTAEMETADRVTNERFAVPLLGLMEHAGLAVARFVLRELPRCRRIVVLCGKGNNGGDGFVAARHLAEAGSEVSVVILGETAEIRGDAKVMLGNLPLVPIVVRREADLARGELREVFARGDLFLDAVVGTGFHPPLRGLAVAARDLLNSYPQDARGCGGSALRMGRRFTRTGRGRRLSRRCGCDLYRAQARACLRAAHAEWRADAPGKSQAGSDRRGAYRFAARSDSIRHRPHLGRSFQGDCRLSPERGFE